MEDGVAIMKIRSWECVCVCVKEKQKITAFFSSLEIATRKQFIWFRTKNDLDR